MKLMKKMYAIVVLPHLLETKPFYSYYSYSISETH